MTSAKPALIFGSLALVGLGATLAVVSLRSAPEPPAPMQAAEFEPFQAEATTPATEPEEAPAEATEPESVQPEGDANAVAVQPPAEGTGLPTQNGPRVGVNPARADEPVRLLNPVDYGAAGDGRPGEGTGDPNSPLGESDHPAGAVSREETFANSVQAQYQAVTEVLAGCVEGMPTSTRDTIYVEMIVRDDPSGQGGVPQIQNFQSGTLEGERAACAQRGFQNMDLPAAWLATAVEAPGFTVVADTAVEYSLEFEVELGAE